MNSAPSLPALEAADPQDLARRVGLILAALAALVAARFLRRPTLSGLIVPLWRRLTHVARRLSATMTRPRQQRGATQTRPRRAALARLPLRPPMRLPQGRGWLVRELGYEAAGHGSQLQALLEEPAVAAVLAAHPAMADVLRPVCHMLGMSLVDGRVAPLPSRVAPAANAAMRPAKRPARRWAVEVAEVYRPGWERPVAAWMERPRRKPG